MKPKIELEAPGRDTQAPVDEDYYLSPPVTPIEIIGYAKNNIVGALELAEGLPPEYEDKLMQAYDTLNNVQEYLFQH